MNNHWVTVESNTVYTSPWMTVREDKVVRPNGTDGVYSVLDFPFQGVLVVPVDDNGNVYLIQQERYPLCQISVEIPGGAADASSLIRSAQQELLEETGYTAARWYDLGYFYSLPAAGKSGRTCILLAMGLKKAKGEQMENEAIMGVSAVPYKSVLDMIARNEITNCQTMAALFKAALWLDQRGDTGERITKSRLVALEPDQK